MSKNKNPIQIAIYNEYDAAEQQNMTPGTRASNKTYWNTYTTLIGNTPNGQIKCMMTENLDWTNEMIVERCYKLFLALAGEYSLSFQRSTKSVLVKVAEFERMKLTKNA